MNITYIYLCIFGLLVVGCSSTSTFHAPMSTRMVETIQPQSMRDCTGEDVPPSILWSQDGHQFTTFIVAKIAGVSNHDALILTFFSQYPDIDCRYDAVSVSLLYTIWPFDWQWRNDITMILHSLHGGNASQVKLRRQLLASMVRERVLIGDEASLREAGLIVHALGDSYAHTMGQYNTQDEHAYGPLIGHAFAGHHPDELAHSDVFPKYSAYANALFDALSRDGNLERRSLLDNYLCSLERFVCPEGTKCSRSEVSALKEQIVLWSKYIGQYSQAEFDSMKSKIRLPRSEIKNVIHAVKSKVP